MSISARQSSLPISSLKLSTRILRVLATGQREGTRFDLDTLCDALGVVDVDANVNEGVRTKQLRREDVREAITRLHQQGFVDAARMRPTFMGFALGIGLGGDAKAVRTLRIVAR